MKYCSRCGEPEPHGPALCARTLVALSQNECPECLGLGVIPNDHERGPSVEACRHRWHDMPERSGVLTNGKEA